MRDKAGPEVRYQVLDICCEAEAEDRPSPAHAGIAQYMLGSSPFWDHINLAYELLQDPRALSQPDEAQLDKSADRLTRLEQYRGHQKKEDEFLPGEIAHIQDDGSLIRGFYDFVTWQGLKITQEESRLRNLAKREPTGRMCLVLQRLADGTYLICFLTSFGGTKRGVNIASPLGRLFAVAIEDTEEFPKGTPSVKLTPKWRTGAFLYALPVPRKKLVRHKLAKYMPFMLSVGELERVKRLILDRIRVRAFRVINTSPFWQQRLMPMEWVLRYSEFTTSTFGKRS